MEKNKEQKPQRYKRYQGAEWDLIKDNFKLLYTYKSDKGNIKGIYTDGEIKVSHWMNEEEKKEYLSRKEK